MRKQERILIVEDEPTIVDTIVFGLKQAGLDSAWKATGFEGVAALREGGFGLVILDVGLPDGSGFDVCREMRSFSHVPIIFLTARNEEIDRVLGLELGGDDYLCKPFSVRELVARARAALRRAAIPNGFAPASPTVEGRRFGPFTLDEERYEIECGGVALALTRYEYRLLRYFLLRPGRVLTREQLMNHAWEEPEASGERTVDAHIKSLRSKLRQAAPGADFIRTHRGIGYSMVYA